MRRTILTVFIVLGGSLLLFHEQLVIRERKQVKAEQAGLKEEILALKTQLQSLPQETQEKLEQAQNELAVAEARLNQMAARAAELERQFQTLAKQVQPGRTPAPGTFSPATRAPAESAEASEAVGVFPKRGRWGPEEAAGPPDTPGAGDISSAWASLQPDAGSECLKLEYESPVPLAEVRIRETHNPGAISKVTALLPGGQELVLWEGTEPPAQAPVDFSVPVTGNIIAGSVKVYLDTTRVSGWNEIDAVELIGTDGSRQWARNVSASSTYAEPRVSQLP